MFYRFGSFGDLTNVVAALAALAHDNRLDVFRLLMRAGPEGIPAGEVATALKLAANNLTFHFDRLRGAGLVTVRREGRSMIYAARHETMNALLAYLRENCCRGARRSCGPVRKTSKSTTKRERVSLNYSRSLCFRVGMRPAIKRLNDDTDTMF